MKMSSQKVNLTWVPSQILSTVSTREIQDQSNSAWARPTCLLGAEEVHLKKMLDAGVIEESASDWVSSSVLIRKQDGSVQCCIGYRGLNKLTVKYIFPATG